MQYKRSQKQLRSSSLCQLLLWAGKMHSETIHLMMSETSVLATFCIYKGKGSFEVAVRFTCVFVHNGVVICKKSSEFSRSMRHGFEHIRQKSSLLKENKVKNCNLTQSTEDNINALGLESNLLAQQRWRIFADPFSCSLSPFRRMTERVMMCFLIRCCCSFIA